MPRKGREAPCQEAHCTFQRCTHIAAGVFVKTLGLPAAPQQVKLCKLPFGSFLDKLKIISAQNQTWPFTRQKKKKVCLPITRTSTQPPELPDLCQSATVGNVSTWDGCAVLCQSRFCKSKLEENVCRNFVSIYCFFIIIALVVMDN